MSFTLLSLSLVELVLVVSAIHHSPRPLYLALSLLMFCSALVALDVLPAVLLLNFGCQSFVCSHMCVKEWMGAEGKERVIV